MKWYNMIWYDAVNIVMIIDYNSFYFWIWLVKNRLLKKLANELVRNLLTKISNY